MKRWLPALALAITALALLLWMGDAHARPGGGHSYSGGSSGGGGGGDGAAGLIHLIIRLIIYWPEVGIPLAIVVIVVVVVAKRNNDGLGDWDSGASIATSAPPPPLDELRRLDPEFSEVVFSDFCYALYARMHESRNHGDELRQMLPYATEGVRAELAARTPPPAGPGSDRRSHAPHHGAAARH